MRNKAAKKLRRLAAILTQNDPSQRQKVYKRLKTIHKENKKNQ